MDTTFFTLCNGKVLFLHLNNGYEVISYFVAHQLSVSFTSFQNNLSCFPCRCYRLFLRLFVFVMDRFKRQHSLSSVWIRHPKYFTALDLYPQLTHVLWSEENKLLVFLVSGNYHHHVHRDPPVDHVHENVKLVQTSKRGFHGIPQGKDEADSGERSLATRQ